MLRGLKQGQSFKFTLLKTPTRPDSMPGCPDLSLSCGEGENVALRGLMGAALHCTPSCRVRRQFCEYFLDLRGCCWAMGLPAQGPCRMWDNMLLEVTS